MAKKISSLSVVLNGTTGPFVKAFGGATSTLTGFASRAASAGKSILKLTGLGAGLAVGMKAVNAIMAAPGQAIDAAKRQIDAETKLQAVLLATGHAAGFSADQLKQHAAELQKATTFGDEAVIEFQSVLATFKNVSGDAFRGATEAALDMAAVMGQDLKTTAVQLGKALNDPVRGIAALRRVGVSFTTQQVEQIKAMQEVGDIAGAQAVILKELQGEFGGAAAAMAKTPFGRMTQVWNAFGDTMEQVAMMMADVAVGIFQAFNIDGALTTFSGALSRAQAAVKAWVPVAVAAFQSFRAAVAAVWGKILAFVTPIVQGISDFIARNWEATLTTTTGYFFSIWGVVKAVGGAVWSALSAVGTALVEMWTWAMGSLGVKTTETGSTVGNAFQGIADAGRWLMRQVTFVFNVASFAITNWRDILTAAVLRAGANLISFGATVRYLLVDVVGAVLDWFATNWRDIFVDIHSFTNTVFENLASNIVAILSNLPGLISGSVNFADLWTPLTEGFERASAELVIPDRVVGQLESSWHRAADEAGEALVDGLANHLAAAEADTQAAADAMKGGAKDLASALKFEAPAAPGVTPFAPITAGLDEVTAKAQEAKAALGGAVLVGSAQAQLLRHEGSLAVKAAPLSSAAKTDMRDSGKQTSLTEKLVDLAREGNRTLAELVDTADAEDFVEVTM